MKKLLTLLLGLTFTLGSVGLVVSAEKAAKDTKKKEAAANATDEAGKDKGAKPAPKKKKAVEGC